MLEKFDLAKALLCFFERLIRAAEILSFGGDYLISGFYFFDHRAPPAYDDEVHASAECQIYSGWLHVPVLPGRGAQKASPRRHAPLKVAAGARFAIHTAGQGKAWRP